MPNADATLTHSQITLLSLNLANTIGDNNVLFRMFVLSALMDSANCLGLLIEGKLEIVAVIGLSTIGATNVPITRLPRAEFPMVMMIQIYVAKPKSVDGLGYHLKAQRLQLVAAILTQS